jgi:D-glycero-alpha-D-manno-heptose-7-phosphate kinase
MGDRSRGIGLVVTRTPLRISFAGGGTDMPDFYLKHDGAVLSTTINKYLYVTVKRHGDLFEESYRLNYSATEQADHLDDIKNDIARECLRLSQIEPPIYISTVADLPGHSGLGSSSSFAVGLLNALHAMTGERVSPGQLAEEAARVELEILERPIGKQDHYAAAFGGLSHFKFQADGQVTITPQNLPNGQMDSLFDHILLFWTGLWRDSSSVLSEQKENTQQNLDNLLTIRDHADEMRNLMLNGFTPETLGKIFDTGWNVKKRLASGISNPKIDDWYQKAMDSGASGGKLCGAGGGGFLMVIAPPERQNAVRAVLSDMSEVSIGYEAQGSRLMLAE